MFTNEQKKALLELARIVIQDRLYGRKNSYPCEDKLFREKKGAFVTLKINNELRGCIGYVQAIESLWETIIRMAEQAAFHDPRFYPLTINEYNDVTIEISVLSGMIPVDDINSITIGRDGLMIISSFRSGLLLPQVAIEYDWDRETFLRHTCMKAGLPEDAFTYPGTQILRFEAEVFGDDTV